MAQAKDLNISPYYDDFDPSNDFYKVLFKPGFPVQARELTNSQSILQNQIEKFGDHIFKEGSVVIPGSPSYDGNYHAVKINSTQFGIDVSLYSDQLIGKVLEGQVSGVTAYVDNIVLPDGGEVENITLYVKYSKTGFDNASLTFVDGEALLTKSNIVYGNTTIAADTGVATLLSSNALAIGSAAFIAEGVYFIRGTFVNVSQQTIILDHYTNTPSYKVGLKVTESIVTAQEDPSLYDNAQGFTNYAAPGADRFKITLTLTKKLLDDDSDVEFFQIMRVKDGIVDKDPSTTKYGHIAQEFARRTYEESGNYALDSFDISVANSLNNGMGNGGLFFSTQKTDQDNTPSDDLMCVKVSDGEAYVQGWEVNKTGLTVIDVDKPRDVEKINSESVDFQMGKRFVVNNVYGQPGYRKKIELYNEVNTTDLTKPSTVGYEQIGWARMYSLNSKNATYTGSSSEWDLYLWDVQIFTNLTWSISVTSAEFPQHSIVKGLNSGATGYIANTPSSTNNNLYQVNGTFMLNEEVSVNGVPSNVVIKSINSHNVKDVLSVWQDKTETGLPQNFSANISLNDSPLPNGINEINITGTNPGTVRSANNFITGIQTGNVIKYINSNDDVPTYNRVTSIDANGQSFQVSAVTGSGVDGVFNNGVVAGNYTNVSLAEANLWSGDNDGGLYEVLPKSNISSVDLSNSNMVVCAQVSGQSISGAAATVSINDVKDGSQVAISTGFFEPYSLSNYSIHYGETDNIAFAGTVTSDSFSFSQLNEAGSGGSLVQFTGLTDETSKALVNVAVKKLGIRSKTKNYERSKIFSVSLSREQQSGSNENNSINDGLTYNNQAYGLRVQDEEISLNVPDVVKVLSIYESVNGSQPTFDTLSFNTTTNVLGNAIIGENIIGENTNAIARVVTNNNTSPSTGDVNKLGIVYLTRQTFNSTETVRFEESNITTQIQGFNLSSSDGQYQDITSFYALDKGQRNEFYDYSRIVRKDNRIPSQQLLIVYDRYTVPADDTGDVFTVLSYNKDRYSNDIPLIGPAKIRATDTLDFRPRVPEFTGDSSSPFTFEARNSISATQPQYLLKNKETSVLGYEYYLPRIDKIYLSKYGEINVAKGQSSSSPKSPSIVNDAMELATLFLPPYLYNPDNVGIRMVDNRRYTMRDIGLLEDRVQNLEEVTTLSLLEVATESLTILDANGNTRYKSGFFVDNFSTTDNIDTQRSNISVNEILGEIKPVLVEESVSLQVMPATPVEESQYDTEVNFELIDPNLKKVGNRIFLNYEEIPWISQKFATRVQNVNPHHVVIYKGTITLTPSRDTKWTRTVYKWKKTHSSSEPSVTIKPAAPAKDWLDHFYEDNNIAAVGGHLDQEARDYWMGELERQGGDLEATKHIIKGTAINEKSWQSENVIISPVIENPISEKPKKKKKKRKKVKTTETVYMRNRNVKIEGINFKPGTRYYQFLGGVSNVAFIPKLLEIASDDSLENYGTENGVFKVGETVQAFQVGGQQPAMTFRVCSPNHKKGPFNNPDTTYLYNPYDRNDGSLSSEYTNSTPILNIDITSLCNESQPMYTGLVWPPYRDGFGDAPKMYLLGQTSNAKAWVKDVRIIADLFGDIQGSFYLQNPWLEPPVPARIPAGRQIYKLTSSPTNAKILPNSTVQSSGQTRYESMGMVQTYSRDIESAYTNVTSPSSTAPTNSSTPTSTKIVTSVEEYDDPLAQSFVVGGEIQTPTEGQPLGDDDHGVFLTAIDLFFANKDNNNNPLTVQLRTMELGTPTMSVIEGSTVEIKPQDIETSTDATVATKVTFPQPVYLPSGTDYAITLLAPESMEYEVWCAQMGGVTVEPQNVPNVTERIYNKQWALGSLFKSQNGSIWTAQQNEDLKFNLYKAEFTSESGTLYLSNAPLSSSTGTNVDPIDLTELGNNPIVTIPKTGKIGISTIFNGDSNLEHFTVGRKVVGSGNNNVTASIVSIGSTVNATTITSGGGGYTPNATTSTEVSTFNVVGKGSGLTFSNVGANASGEIDAAEIANVGTGYTTGDVVGLTTADLDGRIGSGALVSITAINGVDTLYVSNVHGTNGTGGFKEGTNIRYYNDDGDITSPTPTIEMLNGGLIVDGAPYDGQHFKVYQNNHGMHSSLNKLRLSNISSNLETTKISDPLASKDTTISVASTTTPNLDLFEGVKVSAANTGYILIDNEIIGYEEVNSNSLATLSRGQFGSDASTMPHIANTPVQKYELNGVSLARINRNHTISSTGIELDTYHVKIDDSENGKLRSGANESANTSNPSELSFNNEGFYGGSSALGTRNIQFESVIPQFKIWAPGEGATSYNLSIRTVSGTSVDGNEVSFVDEGYSAIELDKRTKYTSPRLVCSKINENEYLDNIQRNKSVTVAVQFNTTDKSVSPIYFMDESSITFETSNLNKPITNYSNNNLVKSSSLEDDPNNSIYVSNKIRLQNPADSLKVMFNAYRHSSSDIRVLYSLIRPDDDEQVYNKFQLFPGYDNLRDTTGDGFGDQVIDPNKNNGTSDAFVPASKDNQFLEYQYTADNLGEFIGYSIKIIMTGTNQAHVPKISKLRTIAIK